MKKKLFCIVTICAITMMSTAAFACGGHGHRGSNYCSHGVKSSACNYCNGTYCSHGVAPSDCDTCSNYCAHGVNFSDCNNCNGHQRGHH